MDALDAIPLTNEFEATIHTVLFQYDAQNISFFFFFFFFFFPSIFLTLFLNVNELISINF